MTTKPRPTLPAPSYLTPMLSLLSGKVTPGHAACLSCTLLSPLLLSCATQSRPADPPVMRDSCGHIWAPEECSWLPC